MIRSRPLLLVLGALAVTTVILLALLPVSRPGPARSGGLIGRDAPSLRIDGEPPPVLGGAPIDLERLRGRIVWLNFWTTSCVPCRTEMPAMQRLAEAHAGDGLVVVGINVGDGHESVRAFVDELGVRYSIVLDLDSTIFSRYSPLFGVPRHYSWGVTADSWRRGSASCGPTRWSRSCRSSSASPVGAAPAIVPVRWAPSVTCATRSLPCAGPTAVTIAIRFKRAAVPKSGTAASGATAGRPPTGLRSG